MTNEEAIEHLKESLCEITKKAIESLNEAVQLRKAKEEAENEGLL